MIPDDRDWPEDTSDVRLSDAAQDDIEDQELADWEREEWIDLTAHTYQHNLMVDPESARQMADADWDQMQAVTDPDSDLLGANSDGTPRFADDRMWY